MKEVTITADYTCKVDDERILVDSSSAVINIEVPTVCVYKGKHLQVVDIANTAHEYPIYIKDDGGTTLFTIDQNFSAIEIYYDDVRWTAVSVYTPHAMHMPHAELYVFDNLTALSIEAINQVHGAFGYDPGDIHGMTRRVGFRKVISAFADADAGAGEIEATCVGHGLDSGDIVTLVGANIHGGGNDYEGVYEVTVTSPDAFEFTGATWGATTTAEFILPDSMVVDSGGAGEYLFIGSATVDAAAKSKLFRFRLYKNLTASDKVVGDVFTKAAGELSNVSSSGFFTVDEGDRLWYGIENLTDSTNVTVKHSNILMHLI